MPDRLAEAVGRLTAAREAVAVVKGGGVKKLAARITMGRWNGTSTGYRIEVQDELSGLAAVEIELTLEQFAEAFTGQGCVPCVMEFNDSGLIGSQREHKTEEVMVPGHQTNRDDYRQRAERAIAALQKDGWRGRVEDAMNYHNFVRNVSKGAVYRVVFERWVHKEPQKPIEESSREQS